MNKNILIVQDSCKELGDLICQRLFLQVVEPIFVKFGNGEINTYPSQSVHNKKIFIISSGTNLKNVTTSTNEVVDLNINDNLIALCGLIRACKTAGAKYITVIFPYFSYCRSDKKDVGRSPIMAKLICDFFVVAGTDKLITFDLHAGQLQGFTNIPFNNLYAIKPLLQVLKEKYGSEILVIISPDAGGHRRANAYADKLGVECTYFEKKRDHKAVSTIVKQELVHNLDFVEKVAIIVDDIADTCGTLNGSAKVLKEKGCSKVVCAVTHGLFSGKAFDYLNENFIDEIYVTNSIPQANNIEKSSKIHVVDISELIAEVITRCIKGESISELFNW